MHSIHCTLMLYRCHEPVKITKQEILIWCRSLMWSSLLASHVLLCVYFVYADQWLLYSRVNLALPNILDMIDGPNTTTTTQVFTWVTKCIQTRVKSNLVPMLQHWNRDCWKNYSNKAVLLWTKISDALKNSIQTCMQW